MAVTNKHEPQDEKGLHVKLAPAFRRALMSAAASGVMLAASTSLSAQDRPAEDEAPVRQPAVQVTEVGMLVGSYHTKSRGYYEGGVYKPFNEFNPGVSAKFHIAAAPKWLRDVQVGYILRNSYGDPTTFIAVENTLWDSRHARLSSLVGVFPTGYNERGPYRGPKPLFALGAEGQGAASLNTSLGEVKPYAMAMPGGSGEVPVVLAAGVKLSLNK